MTTRAARRGCNTAERKLILMAWWVFYRSGHDLSPLSILEYLEEVEANPEACDIELTEKSYKYISQLPL
jgi:hypothetical protein